jgi:hypothetical protein
MAITWATDHRDNLVLSVSISKKSQRLTNVAADKHFSDARFARNY